MRARQMISYLVDVLLLRKDADFPIGEPDSAKQALMNWSQVGRAMLGQHPIDGRITRGDGTVKVDMNRFALFCDQQEKFKRALLDYDPNVWFPPLRGSLEESNSGNWFLCFVPARWGRWKGAVYGVHFDFMYGRPRGRLPERIRFVIGVEKPLLASHRQGFKEDVIARIGQTGDVLSGFALKARDRAKLLESDPIPFNDEAWRIALGLYVDLQPVVQIIGDLSEEYYRRGAFEIPIEFPR